MSELSAIHRTHIFLHSSVPQQLNASGVLLCPHSKLGEMLNKHDHPAWKGFCISYKNHRVSQMNIPSRIALEYIPFI